MDSQASLVLKGRFPKLGRVVQGFTLLEAKPDEAKLIAQAEVISGQQDVLALAVLNQDDERLALWLFEKGKLLTYHDSNPAYMCCAVCSVVPSENADAAILAERFGVSGQAKNLRSWLARRRGLGFMSEQERYRQIAQILGLPLQVRAVSL
jgi:hypothetical protein